MGEYLSRRNPDGTIEQFFKVGIIDDWRSIRRSECEAWAPHDAGHGTDLRAALGEPSILYRFPWPEEDNQTWEQMEKRAEDSPFRFRWSYEIDHQPVIVSLHYIGTIGSGNVNVWIPCPASKEFSLKNSGAHPAIGIYGERYDVHGNGRTIFRCAYCGHPFSVPEDDIEEVREIIRGTDPQWSAREPAFARWHAQVAERLKGAKIAPAVAA